VYASIVLLSIAGWYYFGRVMALNKYAGDQVTEFQTLLGDIAARAEASQAKKEQATNNPTRPMTADVARTTTPPMDGLEAPGELTA
jgi:hypothetical protein